ncbi:PilZ domain-containing protein [Duganella sp. FT3S]|uniref:PilZ domain-containing protein n=1 Tax=Rugamonas fusca TaxID=2758568 RepID=A0A7W2EG19_9BURK|nr:PilZ domain-containing protein [Rugamonas fusca]
MSVEQRSSARKIMRAKAVVAMDGMPPQPARTLDIGASGMSLTFEHKLAVGQLGSVSFELFLDGKAQIITCRSKVSYCIFSGDHFKIGYQFVNLDPTALNAISKFLR